jgi:hypothetical protein
MPGVDNVAAANATVLRIKSVEFGACDGTRQRITSFRAFKTGDSAVDSTHSGKQVRQELGIDLLQNNYYKRKLIVRSFTLSRLN